MKNDEYVNTPAIGQDALADILRTQNFMNLGSQLISWRVLNLVGGFEELHRFIEDVELHIKIAMAKGVFVKAVSSGPIFWYRDRLNHCQNLTETQFVEGCIRNAKLVERSVFIGRKRFDATLLKQLLRFIVRVQGTSLGGTGNASNRFWRTLKRFDQDFYRLRRSSCGR